MINFAYEKKVQESRLTKIDKIMNKVDELTISEMEELEKKISKKIKIRKEIMK
jgi:hypothetical protein